MRLKKKKKAKENFIGLRTSEKEHNNIKMKANLYTDGNVSEWLVYAGLNYKPKKEEMEGLN